MNEIISLKNNQKLNTLDNSLSYRVVSGTSGIFYIPIENGVAKRQFFIDKLPSGSIIPSLYISEKEYEGYFCIIPLQECELEVIPYEESHTAEFIGNVFPEDNECSSQSDLIEIVTQKIQTRNQEKSRDIEKNKESEYSAYSNFTKKISESFYTSSADRNASSIEEDDDLYRSMKFLANNMHLEIVSSEKLKRSFGDKYSITDIARCSGFLCREVTVPSNIRKIDHTPMLCTTKTDNVPIVIFETKLGAFRYYDPRKSGTHKLDREILSDINTNAFVIHRPLNDPSVTVKSITSFALREVNPKDVFVLFLSMFILTYLGVFLGYVTEKIYDVVIPNANVLNLVNYGIILIASVIYSSCLNISHNIAILRLNDRVRYSLQVALYNRVFHMPESYYRHHDSGELAYKVGTAANCYVFMLNNLCLLVPRFLFSWILYSKMRGYSADFSNVSLIFVFAAMIVTVLCSLIYKKYQSKKATVTARTRSFLFQCFSGIRTIRAAGAEDDAVGRYLSLCSDYNKAEFKFTSGTVKRSIAVSSLSALSTLFVYYMAGSDDLSITIGSFLGFSAVYSSFMSSMVSVADNIAQIYSNIPMMLNSMDVIKQTPENSNDGIIPQKLDGNIKISNLSFRYRPDQDYILKNINLEIKSGESIGIVGFTGCGKSTLLRLLLGFETPTTGKIYYDDIDFSTINKPSLRRKMGVVLQDSYLFDETLYNNIKLACPSADDEDIYTAIDAVGLRNEIERMPLGIYTPLSEQTNTISGGQKQRIAIARAIVGKPAILLLDEATSFLDNVSQNHITESIKNLNSTRIVIAHRLSTIQNCDRIIVINNGTIAEQGTYDELLDNNGLFARLIKKQIIE